MGQRLVAEPHCARHLAVVIRGTIEKSRSILQEW